ncbi:J domain-containing protein [Salinilacihabitans rarus]|uniref:J domain-containing protein n=1 Tax=Salinilacihabitans rarus TaxID=2961596 RepID=UPI0020C87B4A|nr:DnaJ domain-containing protein [Salinilacihabitans rarus]
MTEDFYELLDVPPDASQDEIKRAFREQVRVYHPDHNDDDRARAQFTAIKKAYDILGDPVERQAYDRLGHEDYVAKRTKGLPSPDVWEPPDEDELRSRDRSSASGRSTDRSRSSADAGATSTGSTRTSAGATSTSRGRRTTRSTGSTSSSTGGGRTTRSAGATDSRRSRSAAGDADGPVDALVRWWRARNLAWPLIWASVLTYLAGLGHYALEHEAALRRVVEEAGAIGPDPAGLLSFLSSGHHGLESPAAFVAGADFVGASLPTAQWHGALAGLVALSALLVVGARLARDRPVRDRLTTDETIVIALAVAVATTLVGGPLLAGAALLPLLFGVIVHRTHQLPGWSPSYLYVLGVLAPAAGLVAAAAGADSLIGDLLAFVVVPLVAALGLPVRVEIRKRYGR